MFMGHEGTLLVSERASRCRVYRETWVDADEVGPLDAQGLPGRRGGAGEKARGPGGHAGQPRVRAAALLPVARCRRMTS